MDSPLNVVRRGSEAPLLPLISLASYDYYLSINLFRKRRIPGNLAGLLGITRVIYQKLTDDSQSDGSTIQLVTAIKDLGSANEDEEELAIRSCCHDYLSDILGLTPALRPSKFNLQVKLYRSMPDDGIFKDCGPIINWVAQSKMEYVYTIAKIRKGISFSSYLQLHPPGIVKNYTTPS